MKISIISPDLSHNCVGRAYLLAKMLQKRYEVEIVGPIFGEGIWKPVANDKSIVYKFIDIIGRFKPYLQIMELTKKIEGDVIYASKPLFTSFGVGLLKKIVDKKPLILDIDDWQMGFIQEIYKNLPFIDRYISVISSIFYFYSTTSFWNTFLTEKLIYKAEGITVSNSFLKKKFGGTIIWHGVDTEFFNPEKYNRDSLREKYRIKNTEKIVMFFGTPRPHKGIEDLIRAISLINNKDITLFVVGVDYKNPYCLKLIELGKKKLGNKRFIDFGLQQLEKAPEFLALADVVVIPQRKNYATIGQVPAKIFSAMAMAKPIIATKVSDIPEILNNCGWIVEPNRIDMLAETIQHVLNSPEETKKISRKAREKCIEKYSLNKISQFLFDIFKKYE